MKKKCTKCLETKSKRGECRSTKAFNNKRIQLLRTELRKLASYRVDFLLNNLSLTYQIKRRLLDVDHMPRKQEQIDKVIDAAFMKLTELFQRKYKTNFDFETTSKSLKQLTLNKIFRQLKQSNFDSK